MAAFALRFGSRLGRVAQWSEPTGHNRLVVGSSPTAPTTSRHQCASLDPRFMPFCARSMRMTMDGKLEDGPAHAPALSGVWHREMGRYRRDQGRYKQANVGLESVSGKSTQILSVGSRSRFRRFSNHIPLRPRERPRIRHRWVYSSGRGVINR